MKKKSFILLLSVILFSAYTECIAQPNGSSEKKVLFTVSLDNKTIDVKGEIKLDTLYFLDEKGNVIAQYHMRHGDRVPKGPGVCYPFCDNCKICSEFLINFSNVNTPELHDKGSNARIFLTKLNASPKFLNKIMISRNKTLSINMNNTNLFHPGSKN